jgi:hypothetical protein
MNKSSYGGQIMSETNRLEILESKLDIIIRLLSKD